MTAGGGSSGVASASRQLMAAQAAAKWTAATTIAAVLKLIAGTVANGYEQEFAAQTFRQPKASAAMDFLNLTQPLLRSSPMRHPG
jgi:hypothetical protein